MTDTINLQELYEAGKLKHGDEFITRNGERVWFIGIAQHTTQIFPFVFEGKNGLHDYTPNGETMINALGVFDIVRRAPKKKMVWVNVYQKDSATIVSNNTYKTKEEADKNAGENCVGVLSGEIEVQDE